MARAARPSRWLENDEEDFIDAPEFSDEDEVGSTEELLTSEDDGSSGPEDGTDLQEFDWVKCIYGETAPSPAYFVAEDGSWWFKNQTQPKQSPVKITFYQGPQAIAREKKSPLECLSLFFDDNVIGMITNHTNERIKKVQSRYTKSTDIKLTSDVEIKALLGILYLTGSLKANKNHFLRLFEPSKGTGMEAIYLTMSTNRYKFLMKNIRFDDPATRTERMREDKLAPIRELFELVVNNFQTHYTASPEVNLNKRQIPFYGKCNFSLSFPKKSVKKGIRVFALVDCYRPYTLNLELYTGNNPGPYQVSNEPWAIAVRLTTPIQGERRNVTTNSWFTTLKTVDQLIVKRTSMVSTIKSRLREVPPEFRQCINKAPTTSLFGHHEIATLVQYVPEENKFKLLISSLHKHPIIDEATGDQRVPEILTYYNKTRHAVGLVDKMCRAYDVARYSCRWPLSVFFDLMNIAAINALCVYNTNMLLMRAYRRDFLTELALSMMKPLALKRFSEENIPRGLKMKLSQFLDIPFEEKPKVAEQYQPTYPPMTIDPKRKTQRGKCWLCSERELKRPRISRISCYDCTRSVCADHCAYMCGGCLAKRMKN